MPLTINLKPGEKLILNGVVLQNAHHAAKLLIHNEASLLREKDIISEAQATTPARRIYFTVQCLYLFRSKASIYLPIIQSFLGEFAQAAPSTLPLVQQIEKEIASDQLYQALKTAKQLISKEQEILNGFTGTEIRADASAG
ncbi:MAG TPA: flagellar biosynthesis repressor FlbT [Stellaceae bacterium]|nr:flagellar biosynthesis repressor FlbT [Stellaceae bacterium]